MAPKIGLFALSSVRPDLSEQIRIEAVSELHNSGLEIVDHLGKVTDSISEVSESMDALRRSDIDLVLMLFCGWTYENVPIGVATGLSEYPILLWAPPGPVDTLPLSGLVSSASNIHRLGVKFGYVLGYPSERRTMMTILSYARAGVVQKKLKRAKVAVIGPNCPGMIDTSCEEMWMKQLGPQLIRIDLQSLIDLQRRAGEAEAKTVVEEFSRGVSVIEPSKKDMIESAKMYTALRTLVNQHRFDVLCVRCWPELFDLKFPIDLAYSKLSSEGIACSCESDAYGGVTQLIIEALIGQPSFQGDLVAVDFERNTIALRHCGCASTKLANSPEQIQIRTHIRAGAGAGVEFPLKPGEVTIAKLTRPIQGEHSMLIAGGKALEIPPSEIHRGNYIVVRTNMPVVDFIKAMVEKGVEHHLILGYGDVVQDLVSLCMMAGIREIIPRTNVH